MLEIKKIILIILQEDRDRKSTRLNSSHLVISYAVFCLKKKIKTLFLNGRNRWQIKRSPIMLMSNNAYVKNRSSGSPPCELMDARIRYRAGVCVMARPC